ncbi:MAG: abortive infection family protein, partial [candidate division Zixibacteria bacterium]|nr:abortive infection family protein [candidate division Zixibacteria bacterium]
MAANLYEAVLRLKSGLVAIATNGGTKLTNEEYVELRKSLVTVKRLKDRTPKCIRSSPTLADYWQFIKEASPTYQGRRDYLRDEFEQLIDLLEGDSDRTVPDFENTLTRGVVTSTAIAEAWERCLERKRSDPEAAITSARSLVESTCKYILDELVISYEERIDLPKLYGLTAKQLNLAPSGHTEDVFKKILGGCMSVVENLGTLRNRMGDAHGKGRVTYKPGE